MVKRLFIALLCLTFSACALTESSEKPLTVRPQPNEATPKVAVDAQGPVESLGPGDVFELKVFGEPELSGKFRVSGSGEVTLPLIGRLSVLDQGLTDLESLVSAKLKHYLKSPQVHIFVEDFKGRKVYVFGRVNKPGTMAFESGMSMIEVITKAGGLHDLANSESTTITRVVDGKEIKLVISVDAIRKGDISNPLVYPGDIIFVPERMF